MFKKYFALVLTLLVGALAGQDVQARDEFVITTGKAGGVYDGKFGVSIAKAISEFGYKAILSPSKGSLDNFNKISSDQAQLGFGQADAFITWSKAHSNESQNVEIIGELGKECVFAAVAKKSNIDDEDDIGANTKIAIGNPNSGSYASWQFMRSLNKSYAEAKTFAEDGNTTLAKVLTGQLDMVIWVAAKDKPNKTLDIVMGKGSEFRLVALDDWNLNDKLPNGSAVYTFEESTVKSGLFRDTTVKSPCTDVLVVANKNEANMQFSEDVAGILLTNKARITE